MPRASLIPEANKPPLYEVCPHCAGKVTAEAVPKLHTDAIKKQAEKAMKDIYDQKLKSGQIHKGLLQATGQCLESAMAKGYGKVDWETPDGAMYQSLRQNCWNFAAAKNYQQVKDLSGLLVEDTKNGQRVRSFAEFRDVAEKANFKFNETWLKTEYNHAVNAATMASRWVDYEQNADIMPMLKYVTVGDDNVRDEHALLDGTKRPVNDAWWNSYYPPNGWGCRCDVQQMTSSAAKATDNPPEIAMPQIFNTNLAKDGTVFPEGSAYYRGVPREVIQKSIVNLPNAYKRIKGTNIRVHILQGKGEVADNIRYARILDKEGHRVTLLPESNQITDEMRKSLFGDKKFVSGRNPDAIIDGQITEFTRLKNPTDKRFGDKVNTKAMKGKTKQAFSALVVMNNPMDEKVIDRVLNGKYNISDALKEVWIINGDKLLKKQRSLYQK